MEAGSSGSNQPVWPPHANIVTPLHGATDMEPVSSSEATAMQAGSYSNVMVTDGGGPEPSGQAYDHTETMGHVEDTPTGSGLPESTVTEFEESITRQTTIRHDDNEATGQEPVSGSSTGVSLLPTMHTDPNDSSVGPSTTTNIDMMPAVTYQHSEITMPTDNNLPVPGTGCQGDEQMVAMDTDEEDEEEEDEEDDEDDDDIAMAMKSQVRVAFDTKELFGDDGALQTISDRPVLTRARASLPNLLQIFKVDDDKVGVFAKRAIPKKTQLGPLEGKIVPISPIDGMTWKLQRDDGSDIYIDCTDENESNWMMFVRPATCHSEQNLIAYQNNGHIYFATIRTIDPKQEMRVWYAASYASYVGADVFEVTPEELQEMQDKENTWPCFECPKKFRTSELLQKHLASHDALHTKPKPKGRRGKKRRYANLTQKKVALAKGIQRARARVREPFACNICSKSFPRSYSLQRHLVMHSGEKNFTCNICDKKFSHVYNRTRHMRRHEERGETLDEDGNIVLKGKEDDGNESGDSESDLVCSHCELEFDSARLLSLHMLTHTDETEDDMDAIADSVVAQNGDSVLDGHIVTVQPIMAVTQAALNVGDVVATSSNTLDAVNAGGDIPVDQTAGLGVPVNLQDLPEPSIKENELRCPDCDDIFTDRKLLAIHATAHGKPKTKKFSAIKRTFARVAYRCDTCNKPFRERAKYDRHMELHARESEKPIQCEICNKRFLNNSAIACHMKTHSSQKYYKCPFCDEGFDRTDSLKEHVIIHMIDGIFHCPHCSKTFTEYPQVRKHIRGFHSSKEYPCPECEKVFPRPDKLKLHMLRHSDRKDFLCANCGKQFKRKDKLKEHMLRMHNPEREAKQALKANRPKKPPFKPKVPPTDLDQFTFKCRICLVGFRRRGMLVNHLAKRHPEIRPETVPELSLPIVKPNRNYFCNYCEKVYKSSSKRKIHIIKNHPGAELPPSIRKSKNAEDGGYIDTHTAPAGTTTTHYFACAHCPRQYSSKAKMMDHVRKKHMEPMQAAAAQAAAQAAAAQGQTGQTVQIPTPTVVAVVAQPTPIQVGSLATHHALTAPITVQAPTPAQIAVSAPAAVVAASAASMPHLQAQLQAQTNPDAQTVQEAVVTADQQTVQRVISQVVQQQQQQQQNQTQTRFIEQAVVSSQQEAVQAADLLTQAMSELSQTLSEYRPQAAEYQQITQRLGQQTVQTHLVQQAIPVSHSTVDVSHLRQSPTHFQQPQLTHLQNAPQPMSPIQQQQQQQQQQQTPQQQQQAQQQQQQVTQIQVPVTVQGGQVFVSRTWHNYNYR